MACDRGRSRLDLAIIGIYTKVKDVSLNRQPSSSIGPPLGAPSPGRAVPRQRARLGLLATCTALWWGLALAQPQPKAPRKDSKAAPEAGASAASVAQPVSVPLPAAPADPVRSGPSSPSAASAASPQDVLARLTNKPARLFSSGRNLGELQASIEATLGVRLILTAGAESMMVSGDLAGDNGLNFLRELCARVRLEWAAGTEGIFLAPAGSNRPTAFTAPSPEVAARTATLANREFEALGSGIRVVSRKDEVAVTGIPSWINQVAALRVPALFTVAQDAMAQEARKGDEDGAKAAAADEPLSLMVFRLSNAYVDDKRVTVGSSSFVIPGVATLMRQFTGIGGGAPAAGTPARGGNTSRMQRMEPLAGGRSARGSPGEEEGAQASAGAPPASDDGRAVIADSRMNMLLVRDRSSMLEAYRTLVKVLDQPTEMVQLDAFVIDIKASRLKEFGLGLGWGGSSINPGGAAPVASNLIFQAERGARLLTQIRALESDGDSEILTVPSVVTLNNLEATFSARQNFFVKVSGNQDASLTQVTAETTLRVTPLVAHDENPSGNGTNRRIRLLISVQDGVVDASNSAVVDNLPRTLENQISTQAVVRGGDTLVIGGQVVRKRVSRDSGLPRLRDIPILGAVMGSRSNDNEQYVRVYVVRPRILGDGSTPLNEPVAADRGDPLVNSVVGRVPELIKGSGLSPQGLDAERPTRALDALGGQIVVPVPRPEVRKPQAPEARKPAPDTPAAAPGNTPATPDRVPSGRSASPADTPR